MEEQPNGFIRQRRNLMIASLVLLFSEASNLKVEKISAFGTDLLVGKPENVTNALWVATLYWLIRYYQYARANFTDALEAQIFARIQSIGGFAASKLFLRDKAKIASELPSKITASEHLQNVAHNLTHPEAKIEDPIGAPETAIGFGPPIWVRKSSKLIEVICDVVRTDDFYQDPIQHVVHLEGVTLVWLRLRAWGHLILHTTLFTELILPYIVFLLPVLYWINRHTGVWHF